MEQFDKQKHFSKEKKKFEKKHHCKMNTFPHSKSKLFLFLDLSKNKFVFEAYIRCCWHIITITGNFYGPVFTLTILQYYTLLLHLYVLCDIVIVIVLSKKV